MEIPLPNGSEGTLELPRTRTQLVNCFNVGDRIIQRPGITSITTVSGVSRGQFLYNGFIYIVVSTSLIKITNQDTGTYSTIGTIAGTEPIDSAIGFNEAVIIVKGGNGYTLTTSDVLTQITDSDFESSDSVAHINGRFVYIPSNGDPAFFSDVGDGATIQSTSFFDAEELPDKNRVAFNFHNTLYIGGTDSFELFRDTGASPVPFTRLQNARAQYGYISGIIEYREAYVFIGREKDQDVGIYAISQGSVIKMSNEYIDSILITYTQAQLERVISSRFKWKGYDIVTFTLSDNTFGYTGGNWFDLSVIENGNTQAWGAGYITYNENKYICSYSNKIGYLDNVNRDYGEYIERRIDIGYVVEGDTVIDNLSIDISQGYNVETTFVENYVKTGYVSEGYVEELAKSSVGSVSLQLSDDNVLYSQPFFRDVGEIGRYSDQMEWAYPGGLGYYRDFVGIRLKTAEDVKFTLSAIRINE